MRFRRSFIDFHGEGCAEASRSAKTKFIRLDRKEAVKNSENRLNLLRVLRAFLIVLTLAVLAFTFSKEKPPALYFFTCAVVSVGIWGAMIPIKATHRPLRLVAGLMGGIILQQLIARLWAPESNFRWLLIQFIALQFLMIAALNDPTEDQ